MDASMHKIRDTEQKPLRTGFGPTTTAGEVAAGVNLDGKTAVVTGGSSGIGPETARVLATEAPPRPFAPASLLDYRTETRASRKPRSPNRNVGASL